MPNVNTSPCDSCNGRCCHYGVVPVTGYDAWAIASAQHLSMEQFLVFLPEEERTAGFRLDQTETTYTLALNKRPSRRKHKPCIFLFSLPGGHDRCMVYPHRPLVCQTFPAFLHHGSVAIRGEDTVCPKGIWNVAAMDLPEWRLCLLRMEMESAIYHLIVSQWNECVEKGPSDAPYSVIQYFSYLMNAYNRLDRLRNSIPEEEMATIVCRWGRQATAPKGSSSQEVGRDEDEMPWQRFLTRVQEELAEFATMLPIEAA